MFYDTLSKNTVKITLTEQDMKNYSIKSDCITKRSAETKRSLTRFLKKFQSESSVFAGFSAERLFLEAFPSKDGGCILYVSALGNESREAVRKQETLVCALDGIDKAACMCSRLCGLVQSSGLYALDGLFCVVSDVPDTAAEKAARIMSEYGQTEKDDISAAYVREYGKLVCSPDAVEKLSLIS